MGTRSVFYRFEAEVRLSNEPVAGGLPKVQDLNKDFMCGKWTVAYLKNSQAVETVRAAWGLWETVRTFSDVQLNQDTGDKNVSLTGVSGESLPRAVKWLFFSELADSPS